MNERIKQVRQFLKLNQTEFAKKIGLKQNSLALIESGKRNISDRVLKLLYREYNVNEKWLKTGKGQMFSDIDNSDPLTTLAKKYNLSSIEIKIIKEYINLSKSQREAVIKFIITIIDDTYSDNITKITDFKNRAMGMSHTPKHIKSIPLSDFSLSAGTGTPYPEDTYEMIDIDAAIYPDADVAYRVKGDSMEPRYFDGDIVYIHRQPSVDHGEIGAFFYNDEQYIKKFVYENGEYKLRSLNKKYDDIPIKSDQFFIYGKVLN